MDEDNRDFSQSFLMHIITGKACCQRDAARTFY